MASAQLPGPTLRSLVIGADLRDAREAANALVRDAEAAANDNPENV